MVHKSLRISWVEFRQRAKVITVTRHAWSSSHLVSTLSTIWKLTLGKCIVSR